MRFCLWCVWTSWIFSVHGAAEHHPGRAEGAEQPAAPPVRGPGGRVGGRRATVDGWLYGVRCCVGRTSSPKTRRLVRLRCPHHCRSNTSCKQFSRCILVLSEPGLETTTGPVRSHVTVATAAVSTAAQSSSSVLNPEEEPRSGHAHLKPERGVSLSKQVRRRANEVSRLLSWTGSSEEVQETAGPHRPGSRSTSESRSGPHPGMAEKKKQPLSLREAQALLTSKTLAKGGRGDKTAAALRKHIQKERKKLSSGTSLSL